MQNTEIHEDQPNGLELMPEYRIQKAEYVMPKYRLRNEQYRIEKAKTQNAKIQEVPDL